MTIEYTDFADTRNSSALDGLFYDENTATAYVRFPGQGVFSYPVTKSTWESWKSARSLGSFYHNYIKGNEGGRHIGYYNTVSFVRVPVKVDNGIVFVFTGTITQVVTGEVEVSAGADSVNRALAAFQAANPGVEVTGITTKPRA